MTSHRSQSAHDFDNSWHTIHFHDENGGAQSQGDYQFARPAVRKRFWQHRPDSRTPEKEESQTVNTFVYKKIQRIYISNPIFYFIYYK